jgi:RNA polymerase sigma-70 factor (ECF subfamily)
LETLRKLGRVSRAVTWDWDSLARVARSSAARVLECPQHAEDAAQEALIRAWRARAKADAVEAPAPWVARIAANEALRIGRRTADRSRFETAPPGDWEAVVAEVPHDAGETLDGALGGVVDGLPGRDRELLRLRYVSDLDYSTIAERLELPIGTVKVRLHRLHERLREAPRT